MNIEYKFTWVNIGECGLDDGSSSSLQLKNESGEEDEVEAEWCCGDRRVFGPLDSKLGSDIIISSSMFGST